MRALAPSNSNNNNDNQFSKNPEDVTERTEDVPDGGVVLPTVLFLVGNPYLRSPRCESRRHCPRRAGPGRSSERRPRRRARPPARRRHPRRAGPGRPSGRRPQGTASWGPRPRRAGRRPSGRARPPVCPLPAPPSSSSSSPGRPFLLPFFTGRPFLRPCSCARPRSRPGRASALPCRSSSSSSCRRRRPCPSSY